MSGLRDQRGSDPRDLSGSSWHVPGLVWGSEGRCKYTNPLRPRLTMAPYIPRPKQVRSHLRSLGWGRRSLLTNATVATSQRAWRWQGEDLGPCVLLVYISQLPLLFPIALHCSLETHRFAASVSIAARSGHVAQLCRRISRTSALQAGEILGITLPLRGREGGKEESGREGGRERPGGSACWLQPPPAFSLQVFISRRKN